LCPLSILVQHPSGDGDEGDPQWISRWTTNWRANDQEPSLMKALVWPVATYGCESWTLRKNEETRLDTFEIKD